MTDVWTQPKHKLIVLEWNTLWQPVGNGRSTLAHFLGTVARNPALCSLAYIDWRVFPDDRKKGLLKIIKSKFIIPHQAEKYVMRSLGRKWSGFKSELKTDFYEPNRGNLRQLLQGIIKHPDVPLDQWVSLVNHWIGKGKQRSATNVKSRGSQTMAHTAGARSFAHVAHELTVDGVVPSRAKVYLHTHKDRKTREAPMDEKSKQAVEMIIEKLSQLPNGIEVTNGKLAWEGDIYSQVMNKVIGPERQGRVRGLGLGPTRLTSTPSVREFYEDDHDLCNERLELLEAQNEKLIAEVAWLRAVVEGRLSSGASTSASGASTSHRTVS